jgi:hypothetical protein
MVENEKFIIPAYNIIKYKMIESFYLCNHHLKSFRCIPSNKELAPEKEMEKNNYWISFSTELISLYSILRTTLKRNSKTKAAYEELKVLEKYQLEIGKLSYSEGIRLYNIIEGALYDIGVLNIELEKEDVNQSMR